MKTKLNPSLASDRLKKFGYWTSVVALGTVLGVSLQFAGAWTEPASAPPSANIGAPVNTGSVGQIKNGPFGVGGLLRAYSDVYIDGNVGIGTTTPTQALEINGKIKADGALGGGYVTVVPLSTLRKYCSPLTSVTTSSPQVSFSTSACFRYCGQGCTSANSNCGGQSSGAVGLGYHGGTAVEWDSGNQRIACACF